MHTKNYKHSVVVDFNNQFGQGIGSLISWGGPDRSQLQVLSTDILSYFERHYDQLLTNYFYKRLDGSFSAFSLDPIRANGSAIISQGLKIEAVGYYVHHFSLFDRNYYQNTRYYFTYQIRVSIDPDL